MPTEVELRVAGADGITRPADTTSARRLVAITKSDDTDLTDSAIRALWVGGGGDLSLIAAGDTAAVTISGVAAGTLLPIAVTKVMAATTATLIVGLA